MASSKPLIRPLLIGRESELKQVFESISTKEKSSILITGESGVGKSQFLDALYYQLKENQGNENSNLFMGYYERKEALIAEHPSLLYPFTIILSTLVKNIKESQNSEEQIGQTFTRLQKALKGFVKEESLQMAEALIEDIAKKAGLEMTFRVSKRFWDRFRNQESSLMSADKYISENSADVLNTYLKLCESLATEFKERRFVLLFDQFEHVGKATVDFLLNFIHFMPNQFHVIVSFRTDDDIFNDISYKKLFSESRDKIIDDLNGKEVKLKGLSAEEIGDWIYFAKGIRLQLVPDLNRIQESSAGLPLLLNEWIITSKHLKYEEIKVGKICEHISKLEEDMNDTNMIRLYKIAILNQKLEEKDLANYLGIQNIDYVLPFVKELINRRIFDSYEWFRHKLIQKCIEDDIDNERKQRYHGEAAKFYDGLIKKGENDDSLTIQQTFQNYLGYAHHVFEEGKDHQSVYTSNYELGQFLAKIGNLDLAEKCYLRALAASRNLNNSSYEMDAIFSLTANVYQTWGRYGEAISNYETLLKFYRNNNKVKMSNILNNLGIIHDNKGEYDEAIAKYNENLAIAKELGDKEGIALTLGNLDLIKSKMKG